MSSSRTMSNCISIVTLWDFEEKSAAMVITVRPLRHKARTTMHANWLPTIGSVTARHRQSGITSGPQSLSATKVASNSAGSVLLIFSANRCKVPGGSNQVSPAR
ncbi:hypothetical protein FBZ99_1149 [Rhizobium sp. ERR 1071]|nr:hypothetical protein FBZ99_1149 [Rhizobium sp. ERR1071]